MAGREIDSIALVTQVSGGYVMLDVQPEGGCLSCRSKSGCDRPALRAETGFQLRLPLAELPGAEIGSRVRLRIAASLFSRLVLLVYLSFPVLMLLGAWLANLFYPGDVAALAGALAGSGLGCILLRLYDSGGRAAHSLELFRVSPQGF